MVKPGELFAEIVLFERETYPVSAVATERSVVAAIPRRSLYRLLDDGEFRDDFLRDLVGKMRLLSEQLYVLATMDVRRRLIRFFQVRYGAASYRARRPVKEGCRGGDLSAPLRRCLEFLRGWNKSACSFGRGERSRSTLLYGTIVSDRNRVSIDLCRVVSLTTHRHRRTILAFRNGYVALF